MRLSSYKNHLYNRLNNNRVGFVYIPLGIYWIVLFILTSIPSNSLPSLGGIDKLEHFAAYAVLSFLIGLAANFQLVFTLKQIELYLVAFSIALTYALLDELHQIPIRGRYFDWWDLFANFIGILLGLATLRWFLSVKNFNKEGSQPGTKK